MLYVYREKPVDCINSVDSFFDVSSKIPDTSLVREIIEKIDNGSYFSEDSFRSRSGSLLASMFLSTGTKTLLSIIKFPDMCFNVAECGFNALDYLGRLSSGRIYWQYPILFHPVPCSCDICLNDKYVFANLNNMVDYLIKKEKGDGNEYLIKSVC